jgi:hypothetical protein
MAFLENSVSVSVKENISQFVDGENIVYKYKKNVLGTNSLHRITEAQK